MAITITQPVAAPAETAWSLLAEPRQWPRWAPHLRGAWRLGRPEVEPGARGAVRLLGVVPVPAQILDKEPGRSWRWRVGPVLVTHRAEPARRDRSVVTFVLSAPPGLEQALGATYGPVMALLARNLARVAADDFRRSGPSDAT